MASSVSKAARRVVVAVAMGLIGWMPVGAATQDSFQPVGNLVQDRDGAQVTLLNDGTALVTGGNHCVGSDCTVLASAELFDPKTNEFTALAAMTSPRDDSHRAVLLKDGRVLITGGSPDYQSHLSSAEVFDPTTRTFAAMGHMTQALAAHTAALLPDGRVLIAGGYGSSGPQAAAELFNPAAGTFQQAAPLLTGRYRHSAVPLPDGRVVLLGGYGARGNGQALSSVEIYDPKTGKFAAGGNLVEARGDLTANLLPDGRVLVAGGTFINPQGRIAGSRKSVEIYDPATGQSAITDTLADARSNQVAAPLANGHILVAGGTLRRLDPSGQSGSIDTPLQTAVTVDPTTGKVSPTVPMTVPRAYLSGVALLDGRVLILGGDRADGSSLNTAEVFVPGTASGNAP